MKWYLYVPVWLIKSSNIFPWNFGQMAVLYHGTVFNQSGWFFSLISYNILLLEQIIHDIPTWCNIAFNTNLVIIPSIVVSFTCNPVYLLWFIHLIAIESTTSPSSLRLSSNKRSWNMANNFNNEGISPLFGLSIFVVCSIMVRKGNHWIVSFILLSTRWRRGRYGCNIYQV